MQYQKNLDDFVINLKDEIPICFMTKVVKCDKTDNFFLTFQLFKDLHSPKKTQQSEQAENKITYDAKTLRKKIISKLKKDYKKNNISIFESEEIHDESIPKCKVYYDCFEVTKEFKTEIIKTWILRAILAGSVGLGLYSGFIGVVGVIQFFGFTRMLNYDIVSRTRTTLNKWYDKATNWLYEKVINFIQTYISDTLLKRYQDFGTIRVIFNRELQDYAPILNIANQTINDNDISLMNDQLSYFEKSNIDEEFTKTMVDKLKKEMESWNSFRLNMWRSNVKSKVKWFKSLFTSNKTQQQIQQNKILDDLKSKPLTLVPFNGEENIKLLRIRKDMVTFDVFEYLKVCFKNFNYDIDKPSDNNF